MWFCENQSAVEKYIHSSVITSYIYKLFCSVLETYSKYWWITCIKMVPYQFFNALSIVLVIHTCIVLKYGSYKVYLVFRIMLHR